MNICPPVSKWRVGLVCHVPVEVCQLEIRLCPILSLQSWHRGQCKNLLSFHSFLNVPVNYRRQLEVVVSDMYLFHNCQDMEFYNALLLLSNHLSWLPAFVFCVKTEKMYLFLMYFRSLSKFYTIFDGWAEYLLRIRKIFLFNMLYLHHIVIVIIQSMDNWSGSMRMCVISSHFCNIFQRPWIL